MLETDDIDDDYFTPIPSTSLANIFTNKNHVRNVEDTDNESLKYTPLKPNKAKPTVEAKVTDCLLACVLFAYEWLGDNYVAKGKIGLAIIRNSKSNSHDVVLYDSNKRTLSCATITSLFEVTVKGGNYVSYHDNFKKYWTLYGTEEEIIKILNLLKSLNVKVKYYLDSVEGPPEPNKIENDQTVIPKVDKETKESDRMDKETKESDRMDKETKESDTDSSINTKTKMSILNRMATMGQSVLPRKTKTTDDSDSSDNENIHCKTLKHKPTKGIVKKMLDKPTPASEKNTTAEAVPNLLPHSSITVPFYTFPANGQLLPLDNNSIAIRTDSGNDINTLMSEQRICNSELRINMGRLNDKIDLMLDRIKDLEHSNSQKNTSYNTEVELYKKLISEYEYKIKRYEDMLFKGTINFTKRNEELQYEIQNTEHAANQCTLEEKKTEISMLQKELSDLKCQQDKLTSINNDLREELSNLKKNLASKEEELINISKKTTPNLAESSSDVEQTLKSVMNETFRTISTNFESDTTYSGSTIKSVIAAIIKKVTLNSIKE